MFHTALMLVWIKVQKKEKVSDLTDSVVLSFPLDKSFKNIYSQTSAQLLEVLSQSQLRPTFKKKKKKAVGVFDLPDDGTTCRRRTEV